MEMTKRFFDELEPRLDTARELDRELDRNLAHRFNVLDYLKTDELGLSRIIADLLNPEATHGQGVLFLRTFLANLKELNGTPDWPDLDRSKIKVVLEQTTSDQRRIDVLVEIEDPDIKEKPHCLAIENKPYARDQENQVRDYLEYLEKEYEERFLLIFLSPIGESPSEWSIPKDELNEWKGRFVIMPYCRSHEESEDELNEFRLSHSLADWLGECRKNCDVDRLRWFLRDTETFCQQTFGGKTMTTHTETKAVLDFVMPDPEKLRTAEMIFESWAAIRNKVCRLFFEQLCSEIKKAKRENGEFKKFCPLEIDCSRYTDDIYGNGIYLYRNSWFQYKVEKSILYTQISLSNQSKGPNGWYIGVFSPMPKEKMEEEEKKRRQRLEEELAKKLGSTRLGPPRTTKSSPWGNWVGQDKRNWRSLVPELHKECQDENSDREITKYFVDTFIEIAEKAIPIIDEIETDSSRT